MFQFVKCSLHDRSALKSPCGLSCDDGGLFIANVPIISKVGGVGSDIYYELRHIGEIKLVLAAAYDVEVDVTSKMPHLKTSKMPHLNLIQRYMNEGKRVLAKISAVQLGLPDLPNDTAIRRVLDIDRMLKSRRRRDQQKSRCASTECRTKGSAVTRKRDVSNEPRVPAGQPGGGEWESGDAGDISPKPTSNPLLIPAQAIAVPVPAPLTLPLPPTEITPFPISPTVPNIEPLNPTANPYPDRPECVEEWAHAIEFCKRQMEAGKLKPGYSGFGKNFQKCVLGMVSEGCGGNPTA